MRRLPLLILSVLLVVAAYRYMPARIAAFALREQLDPLELNNIHGTAWDGESFGAWWGDEALGHLAWHADPVAALGGTLRADLHFRLPKDQRMQAHVEQRAHILDVTAMRADLVGDALHKVFMRADLLPIGSVHLEIDHARFDDGVPVAVSGRAYWRQATLVGPRTPLPYYLGDLVVDFGVEKPGVVLGRIRDSGGPMQVAGNVTADLIGYTVALHFTARDPRLAEGLHRLGQAQPDGSRLLIVQDAWWWKRKHG